MRKSQTIKVLKLPSDGAHRVEAGNDFQDEESVVFKRRSPILKLVRGIIRRVVSLADLSGQAGT